MLVQQPTPPAFPVGLTGLQPIDPEPAPSRRPRKGEASGHADFLNLPGLESEMEIKEGDNERIIHVRARQVQIPTYPDCNCPFKEVKAHTSFTMEGVLHVPRGRKSVVIDIKRRRWRCKTCGRTVTQPLDFMAEGHYRMTRRLVAYLQVWSLLVTDLSLSEETGVFVRTIREIRGEYVERLNKEVKFETPYVLGLDGVRADRRRRRVIFTDVAAGLVVDLIESGSKKSVARRIREFPGWEHIGIFTTDMDRTLIAAIREARPDGIIVIDLFHIVKIANEVMDKVRNRLFPQEKKKREPGRPLRPRPEPFRKRRATLTKKDHDHMAHWYGEQPELELAYDLKEAFMEIFDEETYGGRKFMSKSAARQFYREWLKRLPVGEEHAALLKDFRKIRSAMDNFGEYILNYFDYRYTNAFTESKNRKIKDILRDARGCDLKTVRARIVYGTYLMKQMRATHEAEMHAIRPHARRKNWRPPNAKGKAAKDGKAAEGGHWEGYKLPDLRQLALQFPDCTGSP